MNSSRVYRIFGSSIQKELAEERRELKTFINGDALLRQFFKVFLFEDLPASDRRADEVYLAEVDHCALYVGLFGKDYGHEDADGISPSERATNRTASRDLDELVNKGVCSRVGRTGRSASYTLARKQDINRTNETFSQGPRAPSSESMPIVDADSTLRNKLNENEIKLKSQRIAGRKPRRNQVGAGRVTGEVGTKAGDGQHKAHEAYDEAHEPISLSERRIMAACLVSPQSSPELLTALGYTARTGNFKRGLKNLIALNLLEMNMPDTPRSKNQKYRLTEKGRTWLAERKQ